MIVIRDKRWIRVVIIVLVATIGTNLVIAAHDSTHPATPWLAEARRSEKLEQALNRRYHLTGDAKAACSLPPPWGPPPKHLTVNRHAVTAYSCIWAGGTERKYVYLDGDRAVPVKR